MEKFRAATSFLLIVLALLVGAAQARAAGVTNTTGRFVLAATNSEPGQLMKLAPAIEIAGTVCDDAILGAGLDAKVSGTISNDLWLAAGQGADVSGTVGDHARIAAVAVEVSGTFARNLMAFGQQIHIATNSAVFGDVELAGYDVTIEGTVGSNVTITALSEATIGGSIGGTLRVSAPDIKVLSGTRIGGDLIYASQNELFFDPKSVTLGGKLVRETVPTVSAWQVIAAQFSSSFLFSISAMMTGTLLVMIFPRFTGNSMRLLRQATWRCVLTGSFACVTMFMVGMMGVSSGVVIPFGGVLMAGTGLLMYSGNIIVAITLGAVVLRQHGSQQARHALATLSLGIVMLYMMKVVPYLGVVVALTAWFGGAGAVLLNLIHSQRPSPQPPPIPPDAGPPAAS